MRVLITAPSLDQQRNVSGIATVVRQILAHANGEFVHFEAGRTDGETAGIGWFLRQVFLPLKFWISMGSVRPDLIHVNTSFTKLAILRDSALCFMARTRRLPVVLAIHGGNFLVRDKPGPVLKSLAGSMIGGASKVVVLSQGESEAIKKRWQSIRVIVLPNASEIPGECDRVKNDIPKVLFLGRISKEKGIFELTDALEQVRTEGVEFSFIAAGAGPDIKEFERELLRLGAVASYYGVATGSDKWRLLCSADVFVLPSHHEGMPLALLEAMGAGCVVVASDLPSIREILTDGENGYLTSTNNSQELARTIKRVLTSHDEWPRIRENARLTVRKRFSIEQYVTSLNGIYEEAAAA